LGTQKILGYHQEVERRFVRCGVALKLMEDNLYTNLRNPLVYIFFLPKRKIPCEMLTCGKNGAYVREKKDGTGYSLLLCEMNNISHLVNPSFKIWNLNRYLIEVSFSNSINKR